MSRCILTSSLLVLAVVACGSDSTGTTPPPANTIRIDGNNVGAFGGLIFISQGGASVTDASVTVTANGVTAAPNNGGYYWQLATPLAAGATLTVQASRLGKTATVVGTLPAAPVLVAPAASDPVIIGSPLTVTWTSASDPEYFLVHLGYSIGNTGTSVRDSVAGSVRTVNLATAAIPAGATNLEIDIHAIGSETLSGDASTDSKLRLYAETERRPLTNGPVPIRILGGDMGTLIQSFQISRGGADVSAAVVSINGVTIPTQPTGNYNYSLGSELAPGSELVLRVEIGADVVEGRATIPSAPVLTMPASSQVVTLGQPVNFEWSAPTDPSFWYPLVQYLYNGGASGGSTVDSIPSTARAAAVATTLIPGDATGLTAQLDAYLRGTFTGPADPGSTMRVRIESNSVSLVKSP